MEDVLEVYTRPHDPARPLVYLDETSKQLVAETRTPLPLSARTTSPLRLRIRAQLHRQPVHAIRPTRRLATRQGHRATHDHRLLSDLHFAEAEKIVLMQDNLNTHIPASLYEAFTASEARRLVERFEWHCTPKHGSWLNMAESELAILSSQCLDRRIPDRRNLERQVAAWLRDRNIYNVKADWRFTAADARIKLKEPLPGTLVDLGH